MDKNFIVKNFRADWIGKAADYVGNPSKMLELVKDAKSLLGKVGLSDVLDDLTLLIDYVTDIAKGRYKGYSIVKLTIAVAAIIYVVSPIDLIPDAIPVMGFTDDVTVILWAMKQIHDELQKYKMVMGK